MSIAIKLNQAFRNGEFYSFLYVFGVICNNASNSNSIVGQGLNDCFYLVGDELTRLALPDSNKFQKKRFVVRRSRGESNCSK